MPPDGRKAVGFAIRRKTCFGPKRPRAPKFPDNFVFGWRSALSAAIELFSVRAFSRREVSPKPPQRLFIAWSRTPNLPAYNHNRANERKTPDNNSWRLT